MRTIITLFLFLVTVVRADAQQWYVSGIPHARNAKDVIIKSPTDIQIIGGSLWNDSIESVFRSTSEGLTWDFIGDYPGSSWPESFAYVTPTTGTACGTNGKLMRTVDGGLTWAYQQAPINRDLAKVIFVNNNLGFIAGRHEIDTMQTILKTTDGGQTWAVVLDQHGERLNSIAFADAQNGFAVGDKGTLLGTADGGITWQPVTAPVQRDFREIIFLDASVGYIAGGNDTLRTILQTTNGGANWSVLLEEAGYRLNDIAFLNANKGFAVGDQATFLKTTDGGQSWQQEAIPNANAGWPFNAVTFYSDTLGFIAAQGGVSFVYTYSAAPDLSVLGAYMFDTISARILTTVNTHGYPGAQYFGLATDSNFSTNTLLTYPDNLTTNSATLTTTNVGPLLPNHDYYWIATAYTLAGAANSSIQHFYSGVGTNFFQTNAATQITTSSAQLNGVVNKFSVPVQLSFDYGTTPQMGSTIAAVPAQVTDSFNHVVSAQLSGLQTQTTYYYRLRCVAGGLIYLGNTQVFFTGTATGTLQVLPATGIGDSSATLNGMVDQFNVAANLTFEYGTTPALGNAVQANPYTINDNQAHAVSAQLSNLQPNSDYYYRLNAQTSFGAVVTNTTSFHTGVFYNVFNTLAASSIGNNSAVLNAFAKGVSSTSAISFEYGTSNLLGIEVTASPDTISDTLAHAITASLTGLQANTVYYYRVKGVTAGGVVYYGTVRSFYTGANSIPNFDFENWQQVIDRYPQQWYVLGNANYTTSYDGSHALYLYGDATKDGGLAFDGLLMDNTPYGGIAFTARPDSFVFYANYNVVNNDTAWALAAFIKNGQLMGWNPCPLTGSTGGNFVRKSFPLNYNNASNPDSVLLMFSSSNWLGGSLNRNSWLKADNISFSGTAQNVLNATFEQWDSVVYEEAVGWASSIREAPINFNPYVPVTKSTDACHGNYAMHMANVVFNPTNISSVYITTNMHSGGTAPNFPVNHRVSTLDGCMKMTITPGDTMNMYLVLYKNGQQVGEASLLIDTNTNVYTEFSATINYNDNVVVPDSGSLSFRTKAGNNNPNGPIDLLIDNLGFDGFFGSGVKNVLNELQPGIKIYPNPASTQLNLETSGFSGKVLMQVFDLQGSVILAEDGLHGNRAMDISSWAAGVYLMRVTDGEHAATRKLIIER